MGERVRRGRAVSGGAAAGDLPPQEPGAGGEDQDVEDEGQWREAEPDRDEFRSPSEQLGDELLGDEEQGRVEDHHSRPAGPGVPARSRQGVDESDHEREDDVQREIPESHCVGQVVPRQCEACDPQECEAAEEAPGSRRGRARKRSGAGPGRSGALWVGGPGRRREAAERRIAGTGGCGDREGVAGGCEARRRCGLDLGGDRNGSGRSGPFHLLQRGLRLLGRGTLRRILRQQGRENRPQAPCAQGRARVLGDHGDTQCGEGLGTEGGWPSTAL